MSELIGATRAALAGELGQLFDAVKSLAEPLDEQQFWRKPLEPGNSFGHLVLHLAGNLNHHIGARLAGTGYVRDREREFTEANPPAKAEALAQLEQAVALFRRVVEEMTEAQLTTAHPDASMGTVMNALVRVLAHFALHRGQMSYIARLVRPAEKNG
jgi:uncharacterized damage-inducible protein DinB